MHLDVQLDMIRFYLCSNYIVWVCEVGGNMVTVTENINRDKNVELKHMQNSAF